HPDFCASKWCDQEVGFAIGAQKLVVPVRLGADPHGFIGKYQAISGANKPSDQLAEEVALALSKHPVTRVKMAGAVAVALKTANWAGVKRLTKIAESFAVDEIDTGN